MVIGMGAEGPAGLPAGARRAIGEAEVLVGGRRHLALFPDHPAEQLVLAGGLEAVRAIAAVWCRRRVVVLASGDPGFHGIARSLREALGAEAVEVWPAVSSLQLAFARAGESWEDAVLVSAHGRPLHAALAEAVRARKVGFLTDPGNHPGRIASALVEGGWKAVAWVAERLGSSEERVRRFTLADLAGATAGDFDPLNVLVVLRSAVPRHVIGRPEDAFAHDRGLITKAEVRAFSIGRLEVGPGDVVWDVGAGCGSVAIDAAAAGVFVCAVERDARQLELLRTNIRRFQAANVAVIAGQAPECLGGLPDPDAVFLGGSGGELPVLLECLEGRLPPGGRLVGNFIAVDNLQVFLRWLSHAGWEGGVSQVSAARARSIAGSWRLAAENPVFVAMARRPA